MKPFKVRQTIELWTTPLDLRAAADALEYQWEQHQGDPLPEYTLLGDRFNIVLRVDKRGLRDPGA